MYTGQIDSYYAALGMPKLEYRSLRFEEEYVPNPPGGFYQELMVVNYPGEDVPYTRIVEYKHTPNQPEKTRDGNVTGTVIAREYSTDVGEPYYPVPNPKNRELYEKYAALAAKERGCASSGDWRVTSTSTWTRRFSTRWRCSITCGRPGGWNRNARRTSSGRATGPSDDAHTRGGG